MTTVQTKEQYFPTGINLECPLNRCVCPLAILLETLNVEKLVVEFDNGCYFVIDHLNVDFI